MAGPITRTRKRSHFDFDMNSSPAPVWRSSGLSPAIFT